MTVPVFGSVDELLLGVLRRFFAENAPGVHIGTLVTPNMPLPAIVARSERRSGTIANKVTDDRFLRPAVISVKTFPAGVDADEAGEELQEAIHQAFRRAHDEQWVIPDAGVINTLDNSTVPSRVSDWATSTGVVQYAALPKGWVRYESIWRLLIRPPEQSTITNRFLKH